jgi:hypothetical protein
MTKKLSAVQLRMAAIQNNMMEAGAELYSSPEVKKEIKKNISKNKS